MKPVPPSLSENARQWLSSGQLMKWNRFPFYIFLQSVLLLGKGHFPINK